MNLLLTSVKVSFMKHYIGTVSVHVTLFGGKSGARNHIFGGFYCGITSKMCGKDNSFELMMICFEAKQVAI
jgi:hypothetical protein